MSAVVVARFAELAAFQRAAEALVRERFRMIDAFTPFPVALELETERDGGSARWIGWAAAIGGLVVAGLVYGLEWFSATRAYPFNSGGRPLNSWPVFLLAPFELGVLAAAIAGLIAFLWLTGLPRLNHPVFELEGIERASQDRFILAIAAPTGDERERALAAILSEAEVSGGAL